jgi:SAM-dependent methyltransferase
VTDQVVLTRGPESPTAARAVPAHYRRDARPTWHQGRRRRCILKLLERVEGRVLDCGCGYGDLTYAISKTHPAEGADVDPDRVAYAVSEYSPLVFRQIERDRLPYENDTFDVVASVVVVHFVPDPVAHLHELRRVLRSGGHLIIACKNVDYVRRVFRRLLGRRDVPTDLWIAPRDEVIDLLEREGFVVEAENYFYDPPFSSWKNLGDVCIGTIEQLLSLGRVRTTSGYFALLARKK